MNRAPVPVPLRLRSYLGVSETPSSVILRLGPSAAARADVADLVRRVCEMTTDFPEEDWRGRWARQEAAAILRARSGFETYRREGTEFEDLFLALYDQWVENLQHVKPGDRLFAGFPTFNNSQKYAGFLLLKIDRTGRHFVLFMGDIRTVAIGDEFQANRVGDALAHRPAAGYALIGWLFGIAEQNARQKVSRARSRAGRPQVSYAGRSVDDDAAPPRRRRPRR